MPRFAVHELPLDNRTTDAPAIWPSHAPAAHLHLAAANDHRFSEITGERKRPLLGFTIAIVFSCAFWAALAAYLL